MLAYLVGLLKKKWVRALITASAFIASATILGLLIWNSWPDLMALDWRPQLLPLLLAMLIYAVNLLLIVAAWQLTLTHLGYPLAFTQHFRIYAASMFAARLPGLPWHFAGRAVQYERLAVGKSVVAVAAAVEVVLSIASGAVASVLALPILLPFLGVSTWLLSFLAFGGLLAVHPTVIRWALKILRYNADLPRWQIGTSFKIIGIFLCVWGLNGLTVYLCMSAFYPLDFKVVPAIIGIWSAAGVLSALAVMLPSGLGLREVALGVLLATLMPTSIAVALALMLRIFFTVMELLFALFALRFQEGN